jgi:hypothetical protein
MTVKPILHLGQRLSRFAQARIQRYTSLLPGAGSQQTAPAPQPPDLIWRMPEAGAAFTQDEMYDDNGDYQEAVAFDDYEPGAPRPVPADLAAIIGGHAAKREAEGTAAPTSPFADDAAPDAPTQFMASTSPTPQQNVSTTPIRRTPDVRTPFMASTPPTSQPDAASPIRRTPDVRTPFMASTPPTSQPAATPTDLPKPRRSRESLIAALTGTPPEPAAQSSFEAAPEPQPESDAAPEQPLAWDASDAPDEKVWRAEHNEPDAPQMQDAAWDTPSAPLSSPPADSAPTPTVAQLMRERAPQRRPSAPPPETNIPAWTGQVPSVQAMPAQDVRTPFMASSEAASEDMPAPGTPLMASDTERVSESVGAQYIAPLQTPYPDISPSDDAPEDLSEDSAPMMDLFNALLANGFAVETADDVPDAPPANARTITADAPIIARKPQPETPTAMPSEQLTSSGIEAAVSTRQFKRPTAQQSQPEVAAGEAWTGQVPSVQPMPAPNVRTPLMASHDAPADDTPETGWTGQVPSVQAMPAPDVQTPLMASNVASPASNAEIEPAEVEPESPIIDSSLFELLGLPLDTPVQGAEIFAQRKPARSSPDVRTPLSAPSTHPAVRTPFMASNDAHHAHNAPQPVENTPFRDIKSMTPSSVQRDADVGTSHEASAPGALSATPPTPDADAQGAEGGDVNVDQLARDVLNVLRDRLRIESERRSGRG